MRYWQKSRLTGQLLFAGLPIIVSGASLPQTVHAQAGVLEEVIVTARKREEAIQDLSLIHI